MGYTDKFLKELEEYMPPLTKRDDFDEFWEETKRIAFANPLNPERSLEDYPSPYVKVYSIRYNGFDQTRVNGWFIVPTFTEGKVPCVITYPGFGWHRGMPSDHMNWIAMGCAVLAIDARGQLGETGDLSITSNGTAGNKTTRGILDKNEYYYRGLYMDAVKAIDFAQEQPEVDPKKIIITGGSQGGALGMAVCCLDDRPFLGIVDVPSNSNLERRVEGGHGSFNAVRSYLKRFPMRIEKVFETLSYFDTMNMADKIKCPIFASVGLQDDVCPAICYFASYNRITSPKEIRLYPFNGHEGGGNLHKEEALKFVRKHL